MYVMELAAVVFRIGSAWEGLLKTQRVDEIRACLVEILKIRGAD